ncbi:MAG: hypothetical protein J1F66_04475 [Clostridiales bacterium]|nr:hypothetical protein [Clostridiales bacterium]
MKIYDVEQIKTQFEQTISDSDTIDVLLDKFVSMCIQQDGHEWDMLLVEMNSSNEIDAIFNHFAESIGQEMMDKVQSLMSEMGYNPYDGSKQDVALSFVRQFEVEDNEDEPVQIRLELKYKTTKKFDLATTWENNTEEGRKSFIDMIVNSNIYKWALKRKCKSVSVELNLC